jgi:5-methylcytosine-specific restriction endonuclease McrA
MDVLILNTTYEPHQITNHRKALKLIIKGRAEIVRSLDDVIQGVNTSFPRPSVIRLRNYIKYHRKPVVFSKENVLKRDKYTCQYCSSQNIGKMTVDHIIPKKKNGPNNFENVVACCRRCNIKKADSDLKDTNMVLLRQPRHPSSLVFMKIVAIRPEWAEFMFI